MYELLNTWCKNRCWTNIFHIHLQLSLKGSNMKAARNNPNLNVNMPNLKDRLAILSCPDLGDMGASQTIYFCPFLLLVPLWQDSMSIDEQSFITYLVNTSFKSLQSFPNRMLNREKLPQKCVGQQPFNSVPRASVHNMNTVAVSSSVKGESGFEQKAQEQTCCASQRAPWRLTKNMKGWQINRKLGRRYTDWLVKNTFTAGGEKQKWSET